MIRPLIVICFFLAAVNASAQRISATTNKISFNAKPEKSISVKLLPSVTWQSPSMDHTSTEQERFIAKATIMNLAGNESVRIYLMDTKSESIRTAKQIKVGTSSSLTIEQSFYLPDGTNTLVIEIVNKEGVMISDQRTIVTGKDLDGEILSADRKDYILIFATDKYDNWDDLVNPVEDAHAVAHELKTIYGFETEIVENPTVEQIWETLRAYNERKFKPQDQLMVFFAGHGHYDESFAEGYVVARNSLNNDLSRTSYISHNRLRGVVNNIQCKHILLVMDVCFGGTFDPQIGKSRGSADEVSASEMIVRKFQYKTRKYLTSGGKEYVSDGIPGKHSPFASVLLEAFRSRGGEDHVLTLNELKVGLEKLKQLPRFGSFGEDDPLSDFMFVHKR